ncbi:MAG: hypothetical protein WBJ83_00040 [Thermacetogeniaceae bacterium]|jgi:hypothetical protein
MTSEEGKELQYQKIWDSICIGIFGGAMGTLLAGILHPWYWLENLSIGIPCVVIGLARIISWKKYYNYRISILKWNVILLVCDFIVATVLLLLTYPDIQEKISFYLLVVITVILSIIISVKKRIQLDVLRQ